MPSTDGRASKARWISNAQAVALTIASPVGPAASDSLGGCRPDGQDGVAGEAHHVAAVGVDTVDRVAEGGVQDPGERLGAARAALREPLGQGGEPRDVDDQDDARPFASRRARPPAAPFGRDARRGSRDERREGPLRHPREDTRVCDTPAHDRVARSRSSRRAFVHGRRAEDRDPRRGDRLAVDRPRADVHAGLADALRHHRLPDGLAARRQGREQPEPGATAGSRSTACTSGSAATTTRSGCSAVATTSCAGRRVAVRDDRGGLHTRRT